MYVTQIRDLLWSTKNYFYLIQIEITQLKTRPRNDPGRVLQATDQALVGTTVTLGPASAEGTAIEVSAKSADAAANLTPSRMIVIPRRLPSATHR